MKKLELRIKDIDLYNKIKESAKKKERSVNKEIVHAIREYLKFNVV